LSEFEKKSERKSSLTSVGDVLQEVFQGQGSPLSKQYILWKVRLNWEEIVGAEIAKVSKPVAYKQATLFLKVDHPAVIQNLTFMNKTIIEKVNKAVNRKWIRLVRYST
jgi:predicted nucleic acid-binding Zn ribbon protein